jgi:hypothetical protein
MHRTQCADYGAGYEPADGSNTDQSLLRSREHHVSRNNPPTDGRAAAVPFHDARILRFAERPLRAQPVKHQDPDLAIRVP